MWSGTPAVVGILSLPRRHQTSQGRPGTTSNALQAYRWWQRVRTPAFPPLREQGLGTGRPTPQPRSNPFALKCRPRRGGSRREWPQPSGVGTSRPNSGSPPGRTKTPRCQDGPGPVHSYLPSSEKPFQGHSSSSSSRSGFALASSLGSSGASDGTGTLDF